MGQCGGNCQNCGGCAKQLVLTDGEVDMLKLLGQIPFLPVARKQDDMTPIFLEQSVYSRETYSLILQSLENKGLVSIDYDKPLRGFSMSAYADFPVHGSIALTSRGITVVELLDKQGISE